MLKITDKQFEDIVSQAIDSIPAPYIDRLENVAFIIEGLPTPEQNKQLGLRCNSLLFGLYEGVPLPQRQGTTKLLPDKITLFKKPLKATSNDIVELTKNIKHTIWHEVGHYFGLNHARIHEIENRSSGK
ncbi:MAG: metallopeptidase family protein [Patescibacteria group bacterium]